MEKIKFKFHSSFWFVISILLIMIILNFYNAKYAEYTEAADNTISFTNIEDKHIWTENEIMSGKNTTQIFEYYANHQSYVLHAGGKIGNSVYTNSLDALEKNYASGNRIFEIDLNFTSDKKLVLVHKYNEYEYTHLFMLPYTESKALDYKTFKNLKLANKYTTMDYNDLVNFMIKHPYSYFLLNCKDGTTKDAINYIVKNTSNKKILDRLIVWGYDNKTLTNIEKIYNFKLKAYNYHSESVKNNNDFIKYLKKHNIKMVAFDKNDYNDEVAKLCKKNNIYVIVYTIDNEKVSELYLNKNTDLVISNSLFN